MWKRQEYIWAELKSHGACGPTLSPPASGPTGPTKTLHYTAVFLANTLQLNKEVIQVNPGANVSWSVIEINSGIYLDLYNFKTLHLLRATSRPLQQFLIQTFDYCQWEWEEKAVWQTSASSQSISWKKKHRPRSIWLLHFFNNIWTFFSGIRKYLEREGAGERPKT